MKKWICLSKEYIINEKWLKVRRDTICIDNDIFIPDYFVIEKNDVALIVAVDSNNRVIVKEEYRYPIDDVLIELPGGTFSEPELPIDAAKRELLEETGYISDDWTKISEFYDYPTKDTNKIHIYLAKNITKLSSQNLDVSEDINIKLIAFSDIIKMIFNNDLRVSGSVAALLMCHKILKQETQGDSSSSC